VYARLFPKFLGKPTLNAAIVDYGVAPLGRRTVNTEPLPGSLITVTSPSCARACARWQGRGPVPPQRRAGLTLPETQRWQTPPTRLPSKADTKRGLMRLGMLLCGNTLVISARCGGTDHPRPELARLRKTKDPSFRKHTWPRFGGAFLSGLGANGDRAPCGIEANRFATCE
jgi:hypothetical protein